MIFGDVFGHKCGFGPLGLNYTQTEDVYMKDVLIERLRLKQEDQLIVSKCFLFVFNIR